MKLGFGDAGNDSRVVLKACLWIVITAAVGVGGMMLLHSPLISPPAMGHMLHSGTTNTLSSQWSKRGLDHDAMNCMSGGWNDCK